MKKVLHIYPKDDDALARYVETVTSAMDSGVENRVADTPEAVEEACREWQPDMVHVHGSCSWSLPPALRIVLSPHGTDVNRKAYVVVARSPMEKRRMQDQHLSRIEVIRDPVITKTTTAGEAARQLFAVYQKVADSNVLELMDDHTLSMLHTLLKAGITRDARWTAGRTVYEDANWRQLFIYAHDEDILSTLQRGVVTLGLNPPTVDPRAIQKYLPDDYSMPLPQTPTDIFTLLSATDDDITHRRLSMKHIVTLHQILQDNDLDEKHLVDALEAGQLQLLSRMLQVASEETLLDEGFMPSPPLNDRGTQLIRTLIQSHLKI